MILEVHDRWNAEIWERLDAVNSSLDSFKRHGIARDLHETTPFEMT